MSDEWDGGWVGDRADDNPDLPHPEEADRRPHLHSGVHEGLFHAFVFGDDADLAWSVQTAGFVGSTSDLSRDELFGLPPEPTYGQEPARRSAPNLDLPPVLYPGLDPVHDLARVSRSYLFGSPSEIPENLDFACEGRAFGIEDLTTIAVHVDAPGQILEPLVAACIARGHRVLVRCPGRTESILDQLRDDHNRDPLLELVLPWRDIFTG